MYITNKEVKKKMTENKGKIVKLVYLDPESKQDLDWIKEEIKQRNGTVSVNQLINDSIEILILNYRDQIIKEYTHDEWIDTNNAKTS